MTNAPTGSGRFFAEAFMAASAERDTATIVKAGVTSTRGATLAQDITRAFKY